MNKTHPTIAICVITYNRQPELARCLDALKSLHQPSAATVHIHVLDNGNDGAIKQLVSHFNSSSPIPASYHVAAVKGIPQARNTALEIATHADYIAFIDDDDTAEPQWLATLYNTLISYRADVAQGYMQYLFPAGQEHMSSLDIFANPAARTGEKLTSAWTCNVLFSTRIVQNGLRFDARFAASGGSDSHFFKEAAKAGAQIIFCREAVVTSHVPEARTRVAWLARRHIRIGATMTLSSIRLDGYRAAFRQALLSLPDSLCYGWRLFRGMWRARRWNVQPIMVLLFVLGRLLGLCYYAPKEYE